MTATLTPATKRTATTAPPKPAPPLPPAAPHDPFPPSEEMSVAFDRLAREQEEVDRRQAEELARLRAVQDRD
jgi:hypothetical protein